MIDPRDAGTGTSTVTERGVAVAKLTVTERGVAVAKLAAMERGGAVTDNVASPIVRKVLVQCF